MPDFVLIPGAWMGAWAWEPVTDGLRKLGHRVYPLTLCGLKADEADATEIGLETHVEEVLSVLEAGGFREAVVVGHSYSGIVAAMVADRAPDRVARTVYVDAFVPRDGASMLDAFGEGRREEHRLISENEGLWPAPDADDLAREPDLSRERALWLADCLVGHPGRTVSEPAVLSRPLKERRGTCVSCAFETPDDLSVLRGEPGWSFLELDSGHWPMVSVPEELVELLVEVAERG